MMVSDYLFRKASQNKIPLNGNFELSPVCNFGCKMCYIRRTPAQVAEEGKRIKDWREWLALAEQCKAAGTLYLLLTGGEPFLYPHFRELYTELHRMGFLIAINSNGTLIDRETVAWLKTLAPTRINITLYGTSPETYARICGHADGYERAKNAILMLKEAGIPVVINASMIPENAGDLEAILQFGKAQGLNTRMATYMFPPARRERESGDSRFTPEQAARMYLRKLRCQLDDDSYQNKLRKQLSSLEAPRQPDDSWGNSREFMRCRAGRSSFWVSWDGTMTACGMIPFPVVVYPFERNFLDCWLELTNCVRSAPVLQGCAGCEKREICKPCAAMIYTESGTVDQKAPYLCQMAERTAALMKKELEEGLGNGKLSAQI